MWRRLEKPLFQLLLAEKVVHTPAESGKWVTVKEAIFHRLPDDGRRELLLRVLLSADVPVVTAPNHVLSSIDVYTPEKADITPSMIRHVLRKAPSSYKTLKRKEKLLLLRCCLRDRCFTDLHGLELLPLANGTFATFGNRTNTIYIDSPKHPQELFFGLQHRFLDKDVDEDILQELQAVAAEGEAL